MKWLLVIFVLVMSAVFVLFQNQKRLIREGDALLVSGNPLMAISMYERTLLNYVPFSPYNQEAVEKIEKLCPKLKEKEHRLFCYETLRSAIYQIRGIYTPYSEKLQKLDKDIVLLKTELYIQNNLPPEDKYQQIYKDLKAMQDYDPYPSVFWSILVVLSLLGWIGSVVFMIYRSFRVGLLSFVVFFSLWVLSLYKA
ncbi:hypothetical protein [Hydrogenobacter hydrogenophilus]|uniref:Uncharacterized protein n=1 Tax=Hydrogenobacter hydrogenophilus TaxID=35835 RepID=A0A285NZW5_9AQUI|nr:hypothetical protein [Hydrogenobacter hydrogenophilus]SNZ15015.1 hypothetical protein SAMN06265353_1256 [Hydrogenobacter hydrogenophilus]